MKKLKRFLVINALITVLLYTANYKGVLPPYVAELVSGSFIRTIAAVSAAHLIFLFFLKKLRQLKYLSSPLRKIDRMSGEQFEQWLKCYFEKAGYRVKTTAKSGDYGADLILTKRGRKIVVQAKRYKSRVGVEAVQQVIASMAHYRANSCIVATNSYFTKAARVLADDNGVTLMDRDYFFN